MLAENYGEKFLVKMGPNLVVYNIAQFIVCRIHKKDVYDVCVFGSIAVFSIHVRESSV